jgi:hypothetical protein
MYIMLHKLLRGPPLADLSRSVSYTLAYSRTDDAFEGLDRCWPSNDGGQLYAEKDNKSGKINMIRKEKRTPVDRPRESLISTDCKPECRRIGVKRRLRIQADVVRLDPAK